MSYANKITESLLSLMEKRTPLGDFARSLRDQAKQSGLFTLVYPVKMVVRGNNKFGLPTQYNITCFQDFDLPDVTPDTPTDLIFEQLGALSEQGIDDFLKSLNITDCKKHGGSTISSYICGIDNYSIVVYCDYDFNRPSPKTNNVYTGTVRCSFVVSSLNH